MIVIIDYQVGNLVSISNMLKRAGGNSVISSNIDVIGNASKLILPGVGSFDYGMKKLRETCLIEILNQKVLVDKVPILGICLGMQLMTKHSEEGNEKGLGWIDASTVKFNFKEQHNDYKVPHMGWNDVNNIQNNGLFNELGQSRFYFVHSYFVKCNDSLNSMCTTNYGFEFVSGILKDNIMGVQFHPEKSHKYGMQLMTNFINLK